VIINPIIPTIVLTTVVWLADPAMFEYRCGATIAISETIDPQKVVDEKIDFACTILNPKRSGEDAMFSPFIVSLSIERTHLHHYRAPPPPQILLGYRLNLK
jgi:hypothetical protein